MRTKKIIKIDRFDNFDSNNSVKTLKFYNYRPTSELKNSIGVECAMFPKNEKDLTEKELMLADAGITKIDGLGYFKQYQADAKYTTHRLIVYSSDKKVYINQMIDDTYELFWLYSMEFNSCPIILTYKKDDSDVCILASEDQMKIWKTNYLPYAIENAPIITSMCMSDGVLFCTIKDPAFKIWYATDLNAENVGSISTVSGYVSLEDELGDAKKIVVFNEDIYVFRDYGITKISYFKKEITTAQIYKSNTLIFSNTVSVCGNSILFMTKDGLHSFNGVKVVKQNISLLNNMEIKNCDNAVAASLGEKYYLALKINYNDNEVLGEPDAVNNSIVIIHMNDWSYEIVRGVDVKTLLPVQTPVFEKMLIAFNSGATDKIGEIVEKGVIMGENLQKFWSSDNLTNDLNVKLFTKLSVKADKDVQIKIIHDDKETLFTTSKSGNNEFVFKISCKNIRLEISSTKESALVKNIELNYYEYD